MRVNVTRLPQGVVCSGQASRPGERNGVTLTVQENAEDVLRGIITAAIFELDSIDSIVFDGIDLRRIFPPENQQSSPLPPLNPLRGSIAGALPPDFQSRGPMHDRGGDSEMRSLPANTHPDAARWARLNPYLNPSNALLFTLRCIGFGSNIIRFQRWIQFILPRIRHGNLRSSAAPPLPPIGP